MTRRAVLEQGAGPSSDLPTWQQSFAAAIRSPQELWDRLELPGELLPAAIEAARGFPLMVPESYLARIQPGNVNDPLLRQVLPLRDELVASQGFADDPVGDKFARIAPGLLQKYEGRALLVLTGTCAVHCRYCFRRHYPYDGEPKRSEEWKPALEGIASDPSLHEVLLSGGDPLVLTDRRLRDFIRELERIPHVRRLRIHSRLPVVLPNRVTIDLLDALLSSRLTPIMVVHANHPREIVGECSDALRRLVRGGVTTLNQAVLLKGINDSLESQLGLCERLIDLGVVPYYLHQLDRVRGAAHFAVDEVTGKSLIAELRRRLPGYAIPRYVREEAGLPYKQPL